MEYNINNNVHSHYQLILLLNYSLGCHGIGSLKDINISRGFFLFPVMLLLDVFSYWIALPLPSLIQFVSTET